MQELKFTVSHKELSSAIKFLEPFIERLKKEPQWALASNEDEEDEEIVIEHPYLDDKIIFEFQIQHIDVFVQHGKSLKVTFDMNYSSDKEIETGIRFALPLDYLKQELGKYNTQNYTFKEIPFFGFRISDTENGKELFDVEAFSTNWLVDFHPKRFYTLYPNNLYLENHILRTTLDFWQYSRRGKIDYFINDGICTVIAQSGEAFRYKRFPTKVNKKYYFSIPSKYASRISDVICQWSDIKPIFVNYNTEHCDFYNYDEFTLNGINLEWGIREEEMPDLSFLINATEDLQVLVSKKSLEAFLKRMDILDGLKKDIVLHFIGRHVNLYYRDVDFNESICEFIDVDGSTKSLAVAVSTSTLKLLLHEISSDKVKITILDGKYMSILNPNQDIGDDSYQVLRLSEMNDNNKETLHLGDIALQKHPNYQSI